MAIQQGMSQQTPAVRNLLRALQPRSSTGSKRRRKSTKRASSSNGAKRKKRKSKVNARTLVKGTAAAKRYMAKIRKMRGKK